MREASINMQKNINFIYFGSSRLSVIVLDELERAGLLPIHVVTTPDKPQGRKLILTPNVVKQWATQRNIFVSDPAKLDAAFIENLKVLTKEESCEVFIVASYGKILPSALISIPPQQTLNIHPSLLPKYRGPSPLPSAMLDDSKHTGISIMRIDEEMDHGPVIAQKEITVREWPIYEEFEEMMAQEGARLLIEILPGWIAGTVPERAQDHSAATYTRKFTKEDGQIDLAGDPYVNFRKIQAFHEWPQAYFFLEHNGKKIRVKITQASFGNGMLTIEKVIPEGGKEMKYADFLKGKK